MMFITAESPSPRPTAVAMGLFDGLHLGHQAVIRAAAACAPTLTPAVFTFQFDAPDMATKPDFARILSPAYKLKLLAEMGVEGICSPNFSEICGLSPAAFFEELLVKTMKAEAVFCGYDFHFGKNAEGDGVMLADMCKTHGIAFCQLPAASDSVGPISSTRIRAALQSGEMEEAAALMGRPYALCAEVVHGRHMGREVFGFPTINQLYEEGSLLPRFGVYESRTVIGGKAFRGVTNVGIKPTVGGSAPAAETHILGFDGDLYGRQPLVEFLRFMRGEKKFSSFEALKAQICRDAAEVSGKPDGN